jgi:hypothetical protein
VEEDDAQDTTEQLLACCLLKLQPFLCLLLHNQKLT